MKRKDPLALVHPDDLQMMMEAAQSIRDGADNNSVIYRVCHKDGSYSHINQVTSVTERSRGIIIVYGLESDMDEVVRLKQEVEDARSGLEKLINTIPGAVMIITLTNRMRLEHCNDCPGRFTGCTYSLTPV